MIGYVTLESANEYIAQYYPATSPAFLRWKTLSDEDKEIHLRRALAQIERLYFVGCKKDPDQILQFPRRHQRVVPSEIGYAQIEQALYLSDGDAASEIDYRQSLQRQGVASFSIGKLSETYEGASGRSDAEVSLVTYAHRWLDAWIARCFPIV